MVERGLLILPENRIEMTNAGRTRARDLVRRHRLAERLFLDQIRMRMEEIEPNACAFEHVLSPELTESICRLLGHPKECPHGKPIPRGGCCEATGKFKIVASE
jgi:DtxR family Mn-dependent transcriptional regulator